MTGRKTHGSAEQLFNALAKRFHADPKVAEGTGFGSAPGLRINGKIFAMLVNGKLVVKLPKTRVDELVSVRSAARLETGHGRLMKEWAAVPVAEAPAWEQLVDEAREFVGGAARSRQAR